MDPNAQIPPHVQQGPYPTMQPAAPPVQASLASPPAARGFPWARLIATLLGVALVFSVLTNLILFGSLAGSLGGGQPRVQEKFIMHNKAAPNKIAVLTLEGLIVDGEGFFKQQIERARQEAERGVLKAIVLRINSPGGTITGSDSMYHQLRKLREQTGLPMVVSMGPMAASGGYYVAMAVGDRPGTIFAERSTWTGSIGVMIPHYDLSELLGNWGVQEDSITSHRLKGMGSFARKMTEEERAIFQALVDEAFEQFKEVVRSGRPVFRQDRAALDRVATGQVFSAEQARKFGLIDEIGFLEDAVDRAIELAGLSKDDVCVVQYKPEPTLLELLMGATANNRLAISLETLFDVATPRAYYLCTWLPPLASSYRR